MLLLGLKKIISTLINNQSTQAMSYRSGTLISSCEKRQDIENVRECYHAECLHQGIDSLKHYPIFHHIVSQSKQLKEEDFMIRSPP